MLTHRHHITLRGVALGALAAAGWVLASLPSGFSIAQIAMFAGPGIVIAIAASWAGHASAKADWDWQHGLRAAAFGAAVFPPFVALVLAWSGSFGSELLLMLLVFVAWIVVIFGLLFAGAARWAGIQ